MSNQPNNHKLLIALVKKGLAKKIVSSCKKVGAEGATTLMVTTPHSEQQHNLFSLGLGSEREMILIATTTEHQDDILQSLEKGIVSEKPRRGLVLIIDIEGIAGICRLCGFDGSALMGVGETKVDKQHDFNLIITIVNKGSSDEVIRAAKDAGAEGSTVLYGRGTGIHEKATIFGVAIEPEKELIATLIPESLTEKVLVSINDEAELGTPGRGIAFVLNVDQVIGINHPLQPEKNATT